MNTAKSNERYRIQREYIQRLVHTKQLHHAYAIIGDEELLNEDLVSFFTQSILCTQNACGTCKNCQQYEKHIHPDILVIRPTNNHIGIEESRKVKAHLSRRPVQATHRIVLLFSAQTLTTSAVNALLKTIEEPPAHACILLTATSLTRLPSTLQSRLHTIHLPSFSVREREQITDRAFWSDFLSASIEKREQLYKEKEKEGASLFQILDTIEYLLYLLLLENDALQNQSSFSIIPLVMEKISTIQYLKTLAQRNVQKGMIADYLIMTV